MDQSRRRVAEPCDGQGARSAGRWDAVARNAGGIIEDRSETAVGVFAIGELIESSGKSGGLSFVEADQRVSEFGWAGGVAEALKTIFVATSGFLLGAREGVEWRRKLTMQVGCGEENEKDDRFHRFILIEIAAQTFLFICFSFLMLSVDCKERMKSGRESCKEGQKDWGSG